MRSLSVTQLVVIAVTVLGGAFVGLFSCGASSWQTPLVIAVVSVVTFIALFVRARAHGFSLWPSVGSVVLVTLCFFLSEAIAASFYPSPPDSFSEFWRSFVRTLQYGPC